MPSHLVLHRCMRTLNGVEVSGRTLRIDFSESDTRVPHKPSQRGSSSYAGGGGASAMGMNSAQKAAGVLEMMIGGQPNPDGHQKSDPVTSTLATLSRPQLIELMQQLNQLVRTNQQQARGILTANPQLTKALFQAQIMLGMVKAPQQPSDVQVGTPQQPSNPSQPGVVVNTGMGLQPVGYGAQGMQQGVPPMPSMQPSYGMPAHQPAHMMPAPVPGLPPQGPGFSSAAPQPMQHAPVRAPAMPLQQPAQMDPSQQQALLQQVSPDMSSWRVSLGIALRAHCRLWLSGDELDTSANRGSSSRTAAAGNAAEEDHGAVLTTSAPAFAWGESCVDHLATCRHCKIGFGTLHRVRQCFWSGAYQHLRSCGPLTSTKWLPA
eukprot:scaffold997_cov418-Prasinococcus_capsulatus_cf.AAC.5